jgi:hypothetical protein
VEAVDLSSLARTLSLCPSVLEEGHEVGAPDQQRAAFIDDPKALLEPVADSVFVQAEELSNLLCEKGVVSFDQAIVQAAGTHKSGPYGESQ